MESTGLDEEENSEMETEQSSWQWKAGGCRQISGTAVKL